MRISTLKRCTECRRRFVPEPSAHDHQKVCGAECRLLRRRRLARRRRARSVQDCRVDERERQRAFRQRLREASVADTEPVRHAPASVSNSAEYSEKVLGAWDIAVALSRASLRRQLRVLSRTSIASAGTSAEVPSAMSRAGLGP
jgi:hypothetical protein